jgi:hypothetical protein
MSEPIFPSLLGDEFHDLPEALQELHRGDRSTRWQGTASVRGPRNFAGRIVAALVRLPAHDCRTDARVDIEVTTAGETWTRSLGGRTFRSHLSPGSGREAGLMRERFGIVTVVMEIAWKDGKLWFVPRRWRIGSLPLPGVLLPRGDSFECVREGLFAFDVRVEMPLIGLIAAYKGTLRPVIPG